jgi:capsular polysaccharide biosynthesis protein
MAEQPIDVKSVFSLLRRHRRLLVVVAVLGATAGASLVMLVPPLYTSESTVLLPTSHDQAGLPSGRDAETETRIASSDVVLGPAGRAVDPPMSTRAVKRAVQVSAPTQEVIEIAASGDTAKKAEALARAVAESEVEYLKNATDTQTAVEKEALTERRTALKDSLKTVSDEVKQARDRRAGEDPTTPQAKADGTVVAQLTAQQTDLVLQLERLEDKAAAAETGPGATIIQVASPARRPGLVGRIVILGGLGALLALVVAGLLVVVRGSRDRRLRYRDEIADAIGGPVIASLRSSTQKTAAEWTSLLADYQPGSVDVWALRQMLRQLAPAHNATPGDGDAGDHTLVHPRSLTVISLSDDPRGLAMGPQIASFAAAAGVSTRLVASKQHESATALWAACAPERGTGEVRPGLLVDTRTHKMSADFTVVLAVIDREEPTLVHLPRTAVTVLAVSAGAATAEDLARAAVIADETGRLLAGVVVADPDAMDRTTGRLLQHERAQQASLPSRLTGVVQGKSAGSTVTEFPRSAQ